MIYVVAVPVRAEAPRLRLTVTSAKSKTRKDQTSNESLARAVTPLACVGAAAGERTPRAF